MPGTENESAVRQAAEELQRYLSDEIAPMMAVEYFEQLVPHPPEVTARVIAHWIQSQHHGPADAVSTADLIYHSLKKLSLLSELELVRRATMMRAIHDVSRLLVHVCPAQDRDSLRLRLSHLGESSTVLTARAEFIHRETGAEGAGAPVAAAAKPAPGGPPERPQDPATLDRGARVLGMLLSGLSRLKIPKSAKARADEPSEKEKKDGPEAAQLAQILATAALESKTNEDLARHLDRVKKEGVATPMGQVFRALGWSLPGWGAITEDGKVVDPGSGRPLQAMNRIVSLAPDPQERAKRWGEMIYAAIEQLNEGRLAQTVSILEVAKTLIAEKRPDPEIVAQVLQQAEAAISDEVLRKLVDNPAKHGLLRKVLLFFPALNPELLLMKLDGEIRREKRKLLLSLLECHGPACREAVLTRLASCLRGEIPDAHGFYRRNLAFLLRRIPRTGFERIEEELELLESMLSSSEPLISAKEAVGALGMLRHTDAEKALLDRLRRLESELQSRGGQPEGWDLADRLCAALARQGSPRAVRAITAHSFNASPALGDALARFEHLSRLDLTIDPEQLAVLVTAIRELAPAKVLGFVPKKNQHELACLMQAVAGTPTQEVRAALELVAERFKSNALGEQARRSLAKLEPRARTQQESLTGDLELFGLPNLLQTLATSDSTGELVIFDKKSTRRGSIALSKGKLARAEVGKLLDETALYALMEDPFPGTFAFRQAQDGREVPVKKAMDFMTVVMEGARRHDEYQRARAFAADGVRFEAAGVPAVRPEDENDGDLAARVWEKAAAGVPAEVCEADTPLDPFRVRRLYAHWVETRALRPQVATTPAA